MTPKPDPSRKFARYAIASSAALAGATASSNAQFTGAYTTGTTGTFNNAASVGTFGNWTGANSGALLQNQSLNIPDSNSVTLSYNGYPPTTAFTFGTIAATAGSVSFDWSGSNSGDGVFGYVNNGSFNSLTGASSGTVNFSIGSGQTFGFVIAANYVSGVGSATMTISNFAVSAIPEPASVGLLTGCATAGFVGLMASRERRRRAKAAVAG